jgi:hypothetical protein
MPTFSNIAWSFDPTTHAVVAYSLPGGGSPTGITSVTTGPDGGLYFSDPISNQIGRLRVGADAPVAGRLTGPPAPTLPGQPATFTASISIAAASGTLFGSVIFSVDGKAQSPVAVNATGPGEAQAVYTFPSLAAGVHTITASYSDGVLPPVTTASLTVTVASPAPPVGPVVVNLARYGYHAQPTYLVITFSTALNPSTAENTRNYSLVAAGPDHRFNTRDDVRIRIRRAVYNPTTHTVTLVPARRLPLRSTFELTVNGTSPTGVADTSGRLLDGDSNGVPGGNYVAPINRGLLVKPVVKMKGVASMHVTQRPSAPRAATRARTH